MMVVMLLSILNDGADENDFNCGNHDDDDDNDDNYADNEDKNTRNNNDVAMMMTLMMTMIIIMMIIITMIRKPGQQDWCPDPGLSHCCAAIQEKELGPDRHHHNHDAGRHDDDYDDDDDDDDEDKTHTAICASLTAPSRVRARHCCLPPAPLLSSYSPLDILD